MLVFDVILPKLADGNPDNVTRRKATVSINANGTDTVVSEAEINDVTQERVTGLKGPQDATVNVSLVDYDEAGNASSPRTISAILMDTIAPSQPGEFSIQVTGEEADPV